MQRVALIKEYFPGNDSIRFHNSSAREILILAPRKAGKSYSMIFDIIKHAWNNDSGNDVLVCAPTYSHLGSVLETPITNILSDLKLLKSHSYSKHNTILLNGNTIRYRSLDNPDSIRGLTCYRVYIDEAAYCPDGSLDVIKPTMSVITPTQTKPNSLVMATTPDGIGSWYYEKFYAQSKKPNWREYIQYSKNNNPYISDEELNMMRESMDPLMAEQELESKWVNLSHNTVYYAFSDENIITNYIVNHTQPIYVGVDYNIDINAHVFMQWDRSTNKIYVFDESVGCKTTQDLAEHLLTYINKTPQLICIDDASGNARQQGDGTTNRAILRQKGLQVAGAGKNPSRLLRYSVTNAGFLNANRKHSIFITRNCEKLIKELRELSYKKTSDEVNDLGNKVGHLGDSLSYAVMYIFGGKVPQDVQNSYTFSVQNR